MYFIYLKSQVNYNQTTYRKPPTLGFAFPQLTVELCLIKLVFFNVFYVKLIETPAETVYKY